MEQSKRVVTLESRAIFQRVGTAPAWDGEGPALEAARRRPEPQRIETAWRRIAKGVTFGACCVVTSPLIAASTIGTALFSESAFVGFATLLSVLPGTVGSYLRVAFYKGTLAQSSLTGRIGFGSFFSKRQAQVGHGVHVGAYCILGRVTLAEHVTIASRVSITSGRHQHGDCARGVHAATDVFKPVSIGPRTWIGEGAIVMANVGADCIVGAGAVVVQPVPDGCVAIGNPATFRTVGASSLRRTHGG
jgi:acetyltransferase-like isoleucine patch superfamily enzyme